MPANSLIAQILGLVLLLCCSASSAQTAPAGLDLNPCRQIAFAKSIVAPNEDNPRVLESVGTFQLACGMANSVHKDSAVQETICEMELSAGDAFVSAAGVELTAYVPDGSSTPQDARTDQAVRHLDALQDWELAQFAYYKAVYTCGNLKSSSMAGRGRLAKAKLADVHRHIIEVVRQIASE